MHPATFVERRALFRFALNQVLFVWGGGPQKQGFCLGFVNFTCFSYLNHDMVGMLELELLAVQKICENPPPQEDELQCQLFQLSGSIEP